MGMHVACRPLSRAIHYHVSIQYVFQITKNYRVFLYQNYFTLLKKNVLITLHTVAVHKEKEIIRLYQLLYS